MQLVLLHSEMKLFLLTCKQIKLQWKLKSLKTQILVWIFYGRNSNVPSTHPSVHSCSHHSYNLDPSLVPNDQLSPGEARITAVLLYNMTSNIKNIVTFSSGGAVVHDDQKQKWKPFQIHTHTHLALCLQPNAKTDALMVSEGDINQVGGANMQMGAWSLTRGRSCQCLQKVDLKGIRAFLTRQTYSIYYILYWAPKLILLTRMCTCAKKVSRALLDFSLLKLLVKVKI